MRQQIAYWAIWGGIIVGAVLTVLWLWLIFVVVLA